MGLCCNRAILCPNIVGQAREFSIATKYFWVGIELARQGVFRTRQALSAHDRVARAAREILSRQRILRRDRLGQGWPRQKVLSPTTELGVRRPTCATARTTGAQCTRQSCSTTATETPYRPR